MDSDGFYKASQPGSNKGTYHSAKLDASGTDNVVKVSGSSVKIAGRDYIVTDDTNIVVVLVPDSSKEANGAEASKVAKELMIDEDADYEVKTVKSGKNLNSMLGGYKGVCGKIDGFVASTGSSVLETLYVTVYAVRD